MPQAAKAVTIPGQKKNGKKMKNGKEESISLRQAQEQVDQWIRSYGIRYFSPLTNLAVLMEETGELARLFARTFGDQSFKAGEKGFGSDIRDTEHLPDSILQALSEEMADVLWVLLCLANQTGTDLEDAFAKNLRKKTERDRERHRNNPKLQA